MLSSHDLLIDSSCIFKTIQNTLLFRLFHRTLLTFYQYALIIESKNTMSCVQFFRGKFAFCYYLVGLLHIYSMFTSFEISKYGKRDLLALNDPRFNGSNYPCVYDIHFALSFSPCLQLIWRKTSESYA